MNLVFFHKLLLYIHYIYPVLPSESHDNLYKKILDLE
jgi:hypothetical protein